MFEPAGGRFGFTGAYGGIPFPIIDTSDPLIGGAQLIWNHLTAWVGYSAVSTFRPDSVVIGGKLILVSGSFGRTIYPYYDPIICWQTASYHARERRGDGILLVNRTSCPIIVYNAVFPPAG